MLREMMGGGGLGNKGRECEQESYWTPASVGEVSLCINDVYTVYKLTATNCRPVGLNPTDELIHCIQWTPLKPSAISNDSKQTENIK